MQATAVEGMESSIATDYIMKVPKLYPPSNQTTPYNTVSSYMTEINSSGGGCSSICWFKVICVVI
jgi:hypothetical protein